MGRFLHRVKRIRPGCRRLWPSAAFQIGLAAVALFLLYGPGLLAHMKCASDPGRFQADAPPYIAPFLRIYADGALSRDVAASYELDIVPTGYRLLYSAASVWFDPRAVSKIVPYLLLAVSVLAVGVGARELGGLPSTWAGMALALSGDVFLGRMVGGCPRAFGFPLYTCAAAAMLSGRPWAFAAVTVAAAGLYPSIVVPSGIALVAWLLCMPPKDRGKAAGWSFRRRLGFLVLTGIAAGLVLVPTTLSARKWGPMLGPADMERYPESGPHGRYSPPNRPDYHPPLLAGFGKTAMSSFQNSGRPWSTALREWITHGPQSGGDSLRRSPALRWVLATVIAGMVGAGFSSAGRRALALVLAAFLAYLLSCWLTPYLFLPERQLVYAGSTLAVLFFSAALPGLATAASLWLTSNRGRARLRLAGATLALFVCATCILFLGGRTEEELELTEHVKHDQPMRLFAASLPRDSLIAGWPDEMSWYPYLSLQSVLLGREAHYTYHRAYVDEMRRRMSALIDAYFAKAPAPILRLRDEFGVTHLLVDTRHFEGRPPVYFPPFDAWIESAIRSARGEQFEALRLTETPAAVFADGTRVLLDLSRLRPE